MKISIEAGAKLTASTVSRHLQKSKPTALGLRPAPKLQQLTHCRDSDLIS